MMTSPPAPKRRSYRKPSVRSFGGIAALTRKVGNRGMSDGGGTAGMQRTGA